MTLHARSPHPARRTLALAAAALAALVVGACSDDDDPDVETGADATEDGTATTASSGGEGDGYSPGAPAGDSAGEGAAVTAVDFTFEGATVAPGAEVTFANEDGAPHTMTADDGSFDSGRVEGGDSATVTAPSEPGEHPFHCEIHPDMTGTLTVEG